MKALHVSPSSQCRVANEEQEWTGRSTSIAQGRFNEPPSSIFFRTFHVTSHRILRTTSSERLEIVLNDEKPGRPKQLEAGLQRRSEVAAKVERQAPSSFRGENSGGRCRLHFSKAADTPKMWASRQLQPLASEQYTVLSADETCSLNIFPSRRQQKEQTLSFPRRSQTESSLPCFSRLKRLPHFPRNLKPDFTHYLR
jgi:hypothetical protein